MKTFIFFSLPGYGHTNPTLNVARELVRTGNTVLYYSLEEFRKKIEDAGILYKSYNPKYTIDARISKNPSIFARILLEITQKEMPIILKTIEKEKPDCIIHDSIAFWGKIIAHEFNIPAVSMITTFALNGNVRLHYPKVYLSTLADVLLHGKQFLQAYKMYTILTKKYRLHTDGMMDLAVNKEKLNLVFTSAYLQPCSDSFDRSFSFIGPSIYPRNEEDNLLSRLDKKKKIIYISAGTIFNDDLHFYRLCISAFQNTPYQIVLSLGQRFTLSDLPKLPRNIFVRSYVPQLDVLQRSAVFITHAGMNSINESLYYGVPMVCIPQMYEQAFNASRVKQLGAGVYLHKTKVSEMVLVHAVENVLNNQSFYNHAAIIQKSLHAAGGYKKAVERINDYLQDKNTIVA